MPKDTITLKLDGRVSVEQLRVAVDALCQVLTELTAAAGKDLPIDWEITRLEAGSAFVETRANPDTEDARHAAEAITEDYGRLAQDAIAGRLRGYPMPIQEAMESLTSVINGRVSRVIMGTNGDQWAIERRLGDDDGEDPGDPEPIRLRRISRSAVKGQIVTLDQKRVPYFTLREAYTRRHIRCYPDASRKNDLGAYWSSGRWIIVEGTFARHAQPPTLTDITNIVALEQVQEGSWREAIGCSPRHLRRVNP